MTLTNMTAVFIVTIVRRFRGDIAYSTEELSQLLQKNVDNAQKRQDFAKLQYDYIEGESLDRVFAILQKE